MMIYSDSAGKYRVQPCLEINLRYNMGIVALMLSRRYLDEHAEGEFTVRYYAKAGEAWQEHRHLQQLYPAVYKKKVSEKDAFFFCYAARLLSIFIFKISLVFSIITFREVILQK